MSYDEHDCAFMEEEVQRLRAEKDHWENQFVEACDLLDKQVHVVDAARALVSMPWGTPIGDTIPNLRVLAEAVASLDGQ